MTREVSGDAIATETLLRCWARETAMAAPPDGVLRVECPALGACVAASVEYWSPTGMHRLGPATLGSGAPAAAATVAGVLTVAAGALPEHGADVVARVADSARRVGAHLARRELARSPKRQPFLAAEQALLTGHPLHPAPKARAELTDAEAAAFSPELHGAFPLRWFAAHRSVAACDSALGVAAPDLVAELAGIAPGRDEVLVPVHPRQASDLLARPGVMDLFERGLLRDLGPHGGRWHPTSSLRTVFRPDARFMLKLSLAVRITNSRRENLRKELRRGVEMCRMLSAGLGDALAAAHPGFGIVRDPAWVAVDGVDGLDAVLRENPVVGAGAGVECLAGLTALDPRDGRSRMGDAIRGLAGRSGRAVPDVAEEWLRRYLAAVPGAVLWLYATHGIGLEAHQQNTLVVLDGDGWPAGGRFRDNQGYYFAASRAGEVCRWAPRAGVHSETLCDDAVVDERLTYYVGINNVLGVVGAMGAEGLADERVLLRTCRRFLERAPRSGVVDALLDADTLRCKANLFTRLEGLDELVGPLETQSVYRPMPNPLRGAR